MVFASLRIDEGMWQLPIDASRAKPSGPMKRITDSLAPEHSPMLSAGGRYVVFYSKRSGTWEIRLRDLEGRTEISLTSLPQRGDFSNATAAVGNLSNAITADGSKIAYMSVEGSKRNLYLISATGGVAEKVCDGCNAPYSFSSDGNKLLYWVEGATPARIGLLDLASGRKSEILSRPGYAIYRARFSPDNRWIAFHARGRPGRSAIYVTPFRGAAAIPEQDWIAVTDDSAYDLAAAWAPDGNTIYFLSERHGFRCVWARRLDPATKRPAGEPFTVQDLHTATRSMSPLGTNALELSAARDKLVFNLAEVGGNVWMARPEAQP